MDYELFQFLKNEAKSISGVIFTFNNKSGSFRFSKFINISTRDIANSIYYKNKDLEACKKMMQFIMHHEVGHIVYNKPYKLLGNVIKKLARWTTFLIIWWKYIVILKNSFTDSYYDILKNCFIVILVFLIGFTMEKTMLNILNIFSEIIADLYAINKVGYLGAQLLFSRKEYPVYRKYLCAKFTESHPCTKGRYLYSMDYKDFNIEKASTVKLLLVLTKIYLFY